MKLHYIFLDFSKNEKIKKGYRGLTQCELNFSTNDTYRLEICSTERNKAYLKRLERKENDKIERGFWCDDRIYNISAIVGENGTGKTTLIHAIIKTLAALYRKKAQELPFDFICLMQDTKQDLYLVYSLHDLEVYTLGFDCKKMVYPIDEQDWLKTKLLYFSNSASSSDLEQYLKIRDTRFQENCRSYDQNDMFYQDGLYDCSLYSCMIYAQEISSSTSRAGGVKELLENQLDTYFNFESYQEARYLFDRNQRNILLEMKGQGYPVPFPRELYIKILPSVERLKELYPSKDISGWHQLCQKYENYTKETCSKHIILTELSLNCIKNFLEESTNWRKNHKLFDNLLPVDFGSPQSYIQIMKQIVVSERNLKDYCIICCKYIEFIWKNEDHFNKYWKYSEGQCYIELGDNIEPILQELMIRFVDMNRAVSVSDYFVIYRWGFSSGEHILLHMFTKLRYLLQGNKYDEEKTDLITQESAQSEQDACRKEYIVNQIQREKKKVCDSVILFLDEADLSLHPEWQRMFVATLAEFLPRVYKDPYYEETEDGCKEIQIILTTHSPLMLGDFPSSCVLYLQKDENGIVKVESNHVLQPFGQNLYTLLKDGFYLKNGTVGSLVQKKIKSILKTIQDIKKGLDRSDRGIVLERWENELEEHKQKTIKYLPRGIIRSKLEEEIAITLTALSQKKSLDKKEQQKLKLKENIAKLEKQLKELEQEETSL